MTMNLGKKPTIFVYLFFSLFLYFVFIDEVADVFLINISSIILSHNSRIHENVIVFLLLVLQIIFSPLQSGFSDYYLRRKSLIISISATLISVIFLKLSISYGVFFLFLSIILKGVIGNTLPIAWAGIAENTKGNNIRFALALSICALAIGSWLALLTIPHLFINIFFLLVLILVVIGLIFIYPFKDSKDTLKPHFLEKMSLSEMIINECIGIYRLVKKPLNFLALISFLFSEISFYQILFRIEVFNSYKCFIHIPLAIGIGYSIGTLILKFIKLKDKKTSLIGIIISIISITSINISFMFDFKNQIVFTILFISYSLGYAFFTPALFSLITPRAHPHLNGKIYGMLESIDSLASLITFIILFSTQELTCSVILIISEMFIIFSLLIFCYIFRKTQVDH